MAYSKAKLKGNDDRASPCLKPFPTGNMSDKCLSTQTLLYVSVRHIFISLASFMGIPNSIRIFYKTSLLTESFFVVFQFLSQVFDECRIMISS